MTHPPIHSWLPALVGVLLALPVHAGGIEISNGAAKGKLSPVSVSLNDGALEVI